MSFQIQSQQENLAESFKSKAMMASDFLRDLESQIEAKADILKSIGICFRIRGTSGDGTANYFDNHNIGNSALSKLIESFPNTSSSMRKELERKFRAEYSQRETIFSDPAYFEKVEHYLIDLRTREMIKSIEWLKEARTPSGYQWESKNYSIVPKEVRLMATPSLASNDNSWHYRSSSYFDHIRQLELALICLDGKKPSAELLGDKISDTWEEEARKAGHDKSKIETFNFKCDYFKLKAYRTIPARLTFTNHALSLLNQDSNYAERLASSNASVIKREALETRHIDAFSWLRRCPTRVNKVLEEKNYNIVPKTVRIDATPSISVNHDHECFWDSHIWENIAGLEHALFRLSGQKLPDRFVYQHIISTWKSEYQHGRQIAVRAKQHRKVDLMAVGLKAIKTMKFSGKFFTIRAYRKAGACITFTDEALSIINGDNFSDKDERSSNYQEDVKPLDEFAKVVEFEQAWREKRAQLRAQSMHKLEDAKPAVNDSSPKPQTECLQEPTGTIRVTFSEENGFIVSGSTRELSSKLGRKGLGLSYWGVDKFWYIRGSKGKPWHPNYHRYIDELEKICKAARFRFVNESQLAIAA